MLYELVRRGGKADKNEFMGSIAVNYGIRRKTQEEYLEDLKYSGAIDITENNIILKWDMDKAKDWLKTKLQNRIVPKMNESLSKTNAIIQRVKQKIYPQMLFRVKFPVLGMENNTKEKEVKAVD